MSNATGSRIAVMATCHNRRPQTLASLRALHHSAGQAGAPIQVFLTDDGSADGTSDAVMAEFPDTKIIQGSGSMFWAAGMRAAEDEAVTSKPDYYLWLNDDTVADPEAVAVLLTTSRDLGGCIVVAALRDPTSGVQTYGGRVRVGRHPQRFALMPVSDQVQFADTFNGNLVLIPARVRQAVGPIDGSFPHAYADDDYGLRATELGIPIVQAPNTLGTCARNPPRQTPDGVVARWHAVQSPKGTPWSAQARYLRRHGDWWWPALLAAGHLRKVLLPGHSALRSTADE